MKPLTTIAILFIVFFGANHLVAQQPLFAPLGAVWHYEMYNCPPLPSPQPVVVTVTEDTIINLKYCTKLPNGGCHSNASCNDYVYVHQDGSKVFVYETLFNDFQMLFDFSLQTGDSYTYILCKDKWGVDTVTVYVDFADIDPEGVQQLRIVPNQPVWWGETGAQIVKGVGGTYFSNILLFDEILCENITFECPWWVFKCYETPDSINYPPGCFVSAVGEPQVPENGVHVYPNPASTTATFHFDNLPNTPKTLSIFNNLGQALVSTNMAIGQQSVEIALADMADGLYFWSVVSDGRQVGSGKLIILK